MSKTSARGFLESLGLPHQSGIESHIKGWEGWYKSNADWYKMRGLNMQTGMVYSRSRATLHPARLVAQEWASLLVNERTAVRIDSGAEGASSIASEWVEKWIAQTRFMLNVQELVERAFALGTGALALKVDGATLGAPSTDARIRVIRFSGSDIIPISYEDRVCTEAAFISGTYEDGQHLEQLLIMRRSGDGRYVSEPYFFNRSGKQVLLEGYEPIYHGMTQPFALIRPGLGNIYDEHSPMGVSIFDDAVDAIKQTDRVWDNFGNDFEHGGKMLFLPETMMRQDKEGNWITPTIASQTAFIIGENDDKQPYEHNPDLRVDQNERGLNMALSALSLRCGLGADYWAINASTGGIKTATEVVSEDSDLFRNLRKHENVIAPALETLIRAAIETANIVAGAGIPEPLTVEMQFDDSIIEDTDAMKLRDREDVSVGLLAPWEYRMRWNGESEEQAKASIAEIIAIHGGIEAPLL